MIFSITIRFITTLSIVLFSLQLLGQNIPDDRITDWSKAGSSCIDNSADTVFIDQLGIAGDLDLYFDSLFYQAQDSLSTLGGGTIMIPSGIFLIDTSLRIVSNISIVGRGYQNTLLQFDLNGTPYDPFIVQGSSASAYDTLVLTLQKDSSSFSVSDASIYQLGQTIRMVEDDNGRIFSSWSSNNIGQIFSIDAIDTISNIITTTQPSRLDFNPSLFPRIQSYNPKKNIEICGLKINRLDATSAQTSNVYFRLAENCKVEGIESNNSNFAHLEINVSKDITVENCYFHHAHNYGGGGQGYGVVVQATSGDILVQNNIFNHLRHSVLLQSCANGNVISYNYSIDPYWTGVTLPSNSAGDMVLHGNYPYLNLFEGNICQNIVIDNSHGINGHHNTFFRNRAELYGLFMNSNPASDSQNFIGNEIPNISLFQGLYTLEGTDHYTFGNNHKGSTKPSGTSNLTQKSMYLDGYPHFWDLNMTLFPSIGYPNEDMNGAIPSSIHYLNSELADCNADTALLRAYLCSTDSISIGGYWHGNDSVISNTQFNGKCLIPVEFEVIQAAPIVIGQNTETLTINVANASDFLWSYNGLDNGNISNEHIATDNGDYSCLVSIVEDGLNAACQSDTVSISGLSINQNDLTYHLYPNPGTNELILLVNQKCKVLLQSQLGEIIQSFDLQDRQIVNTHHLSSGIYHLTIISSDDEIRNIKWIKQ